MKLQHLGIIAFCLSLVGCPQSTSRFEIAVDGNGMTNPSPGVHAYASGTTLKVSALPAEGATFSGWSGAAAGSANPVSLVVEGEQKLVAHFSRETGGSGGGASSDGAAAGGGAAGGGSGGGDPGSGAVEVVVSINAGGTEAGSFVADGYFSGGDTYSTTNEIDTSLITDSGPPAAVFQTERYGEFSYTIPNRTPASPQTVTLFFQESLWEQAGQRTFDVAINGATVLTAFDIYAAAGGMNKAIAKTFTITADASGQVVIQFSKNGGPDNPKVCGITVKGSGSSGAGGGAGDGGGSDTGGGSGGNITGPCDIYEAGNTPCVAAHSTVRALYGSYNGRLYQVRRADNTTKDITALSAGGLADSASQDEFCAGAKCVISIIYDQSPRQNDLTKTSGGWIGNNAKEADAAGIKISLGGHPVYGVHVPSGVGYRNNMTTGIALNDDPEGMYMVANGKNYNDGCCFDYGNAETDSLDDGNGTMEAIYFGNCGAWGRGDGQGPWVMADLENGLFSGKAAGLNAANKSITYDYVTAILNGKPHTWAIKAGDSQSGGLTTLYEGSRPNGGYDPMKKQGAIILGTGGDNSYGARGDFFEGAMTSGYPTQEVDDAVQANIVAAGYGR